MSEDTVKKLERGQRVSLWRHPQDILTWDFAERVGLRVYDNDALDRAAQLAYYFVLSIFPLLLVLTTIFGFFTSSNELRSQLFSYLGRLVPPSAFDLIQKTVLEVTNNASGGKLSFGLLLSIWAASNSMIATTSGLNAAYGLKETRSWWHVRLIALGLTLSLALLILVSLSMFIYGNSLGANLTRYLGGGESFARVWPFIHYPLLGLLLCLAFAVIYHFAPNRTPPRWYFITPGAVVGVLMWVLVSAGFKTYLGYFDNYSATYGSLGAVIALMFWFYFTSVAILIGGEVNAEVEYPTKKKSEDKIASQEAAAEDHNTNVEQSNAAAK